MTKKDELEQKELERLNIESHQRYEQELKEGIKRERELEQEQEREKNEQLQKKEMLDKESELTEKAIGRDKDLEKAIDNKEVTAESLRGHEELLQLKKEMEEHYKELEREQQQERELEREREERER